MSDVQQLVSTDFLVVTTVSFRVLYVFVVVAHHRRHAIHFNVTTHPTAEWTARQIAEAFPRTPYSEIKYLESLRKKGSSLLLFAANNPA